MQLNHRFLAQITRIMDTVAFFDDSISTPNNFATAREEIGELSKNS